MYETDFGNLPFNWQTQVPGAFVMLASATETSTAGPEHLVLLVGANPVPNYLTAKTLMPKRVTLLYTEETKEIRERLAGVLVKLGIGIESSPALAKPLASGHAAKEIRDRCTQLQDKPWLDYTGGTKVMSAHARSSRRGEASVWGAISYLDESAGVLRIEHPNPQMRQIPEDALTLKLLFEIHGLYDKDGDADKFYEYAKESPDTWLKCAQSMWGIVEKDHLKLCALLYSFYESVEDKYLMETIADKRKVLPTCIQDAVQELDDKFTSVDRPERRKVCKFIGGVWLDLWVAMQTRSILPASGAVHCSVKPRVPEVGIEQKNFPYFELDVVAMHSNRLHVISCTTDADLELCRHKAFEVMQRAYQLGGDLARPAIACFLDETDAKLLKEDLCDVWTAPSSLEVFGIETLRAWSAGNHETLNVWLDAGSMAK